MFEYNVNYDIEVQADLINNTVKMKNKKLDNTLFAQSDIEFACN